MNRILNKKYITLALIAVLVVAGLFNRNYQAPSNEDTAKILGEAAYVNNDVAVNDEINDDSKPLKREKARDEAKEMLEEIIENPATTEEGRKKAEQEMINIAKTIKNEADCEILLEEKGFENPVVTITNNSASVSVNIKDIMGTEIAQITETISTVTGIEPDKIKILSDD